MKLTCQMILPGGIAGIACGKPVGDAFCPEHLELFMNQDQITDFLNKALDKGFDVHAILNRVTTIRCGLADTTARNREWGTNSKYIFGVKTKDECFDDLWGGFCIGIVKKDFWENERRCLEDRHISGEIYLPDDGLGFSEEMESTFGCVSNTAMGVVTREMVIRSLTQAGFIHSTDLQDWILDHDP
jgi:hypothetical protein